MMSKRDIRRELFACPDLPEQEEIVNLLDAVHARTSAQFKKLAVLQEVRKSLLQNLITGKVRIPERVLNG